MILENSGNFWKLLEHFLLFTEIPTEQMLQRQIYVQNIQYDVLLRTVDQACPLSRLERV